MSNDPLIALKSYLTAYSPLGGIPVYNEELPETVNAALVAATAQGTPYTVIVLMPMGGTAQGQTSRQNQPRTDINVYATSRMVARQTAELVKSALKKPLNYKDGAGNTLASAVMTVNITSRREQDQTCLAWTTWILNSSL